jgi:anti-sigma factor RsiW
MSAHDITCRELVEVITDFLEGALPVEQRDLVERHLAMCTWCATYLDQMRHTLRVTGQLREDDVPEPVLDALSHLFRTRHTHQGDA